MSTHIRPAKIPAARGFSLIEVVLALGVISFALVAILGVFPTGLAANRTSIGDTRAAQLANAIAATVDAQSATFSNVNCFGATLDLSNLGKSSPPQMLYAKYPSPNQPQITKTSDANSIYTIELRFDNNPPVNPLGTGIGPGKLNQIQIRVRGKTSASNFAEFFYLARSKT